MKSLKKIAFFPLLLMACLGILVAANAKPAQAAVKDGWYSVPIGLATKFSKTGRKLTVNARKKYWDSMAYYVAAGKKQKVLKTIKPLKGKLSCRISPKCKYLHMDTGMRRQKVTYSYIRNTYIRERKEAKRLGTDLYLDYVVDLIIRVQNGKVTEVCIMHQ